MDIMEHPVWDDVAEACNQALGMSWDGCHKIYLSMDEAEVAKMVGYGYDMESPDLEIIQRWFDGSCGLRFISAVRTVEGDPNEGFTSLIPQFFFEDLMCDDCGDEIDGGGRDGLCDDCADLHDED